MIPVLARLRLMVSGSEAPAVFNRFQGVTATTWQATPASLRTSPKRSVKVSAWIDDAIFDHRSVELKRDGRSGMLQEDWSDERIECEEVISFFCDD
jgi:UDP-galactopyranose mutase